MEFLTILLSGLLGLVSPAGLILDRIAENAIRSEFKKVDQLQVRVDNAPSYQLLQGKVERVRIAGRGLQLKQDIRIAVLELETDPIVLEPRSIRQRQPKLKQPIQAGVRLVLTQQDINQALKSPAVTGILRNLSISELGNSSNNSGQRYNFVNPRVEFLVNNRLRFQAELIQGNAKPLAISVESGLGVMAGRQIQLIAPVVSVDGSEVPSQFVSLLLTNFSQRLDLDNLESGLKARVLQLKVTPKELEIAAFLRVEPSARFLKDRAMSM